MPYVSVKKAVFSPPLFSIINCSPLNPRGRVPSSAHLHLLQVSYINTSISCLSLCLLLNSFCAETQRTWASVSPDTRCYLVAQSLSCVWLFATPWTVAHQAPLSMEILWARTLEWVAMPSSRVSSQPRDQTQVSCFASRLFTVWATKEASYISLDHIN